jgi:hypothetical protein
VRIGLCRVKATKDRLDCSIDEEMNGNTSYRGRIRGLTQRDGLGRGKGTYAHVLLRVVYFLINFPFLDISGILLPLLSSSPNLHPRTLCSAFLPLFFFFLSRRSSRTTSTNRVPSGALSLPAEGPDPNIQNPLIITLASVALTRNTPSCRKSPGDRSSYVIYIPLCVV